MFSEKTHRYLFLFGVCSLAFGIMMGTVPTSLPQFILLGNWIIEGGFKNKFSLLRKNKFFWIISSLFLLHLVGMLYTQDIDSGLTDIRIKLPLLFLPMLFFSTKPLNEKEFKALLYCFLLGSFANTAWCLIYNYILHSTEAARNASRFMSHIRLGLYLNVAISCCFYFICVNAKMVNKLLFGVLMAYFIFVLYALGLASGLVNLFILCAFAAIMFYFKQKLIIKITSLVIVFISVFYATNFLLSIFNAQLITQVSENNTPHKSNATGKSYLNYESSTQKENGNFVFINIQPNELKKEWQLRFPEDSFSYMPNLHNIRRYQVLLRYMASKGLNKDSAGLTKLNAEDFKNIQKNITNYKYPTWSFLQKRVNEFIWEYDEYVHERSINGHSLTMRLYFWKAARALIKKNILFGVGTGDVQIELNKTYVETRSPLAKEWYKRPHNQYITMTVALGVIGLLVFLFSFLYPLINLKKYLHPLFWPYFLILILSFVLEDTLETQAGLSFYAFFYTLFIANAFFKKQQNPAG
ncbi:MAG: O-antigen ligase family protein [Bacteroidetes bacterium]|nr:O-antigen ligase family protein [Bacteroidota bacterium]